MPTTELTGTTAPGRYSTTGATMTMTAADTTNQNHIDSVETVTIIAHNTGVSAQTVTITSAADNATGRTGDVNAVSLAADEIRIFRLQQNGWSDANDHYLIEANSTDVKFGWFADK